ncbi:MAG: UpxY family transcription antiterminator [Acidobacteriota bacterium]|nr:UpxY family transcription antiterminator [Acidobacteriota bacterium]
MVKPRFEKSVSSLLRLKGFEEFTPLISQSQKWSDRIKIIELPLFPRYVFCRFSFEDRLAIFTTPGIVKIVGFGGAPTPVPDKEIDDLRAAMMAGTPLFNCEYMALGDRVRVTKGPLAGMEGFFVAARGRSRVVLSVHLLQRSVYAEVEMEWTQPVAKPPLREFTVGLGANETGRTSLRQ